jgi:hypothetical protein
MKKNVLFCLLGVALAVIAIPLVRRVHAQTPAQTRIYIPWMTGTDAGYTSLLLVENTSVDPYGTSPSTGSTCTVDAEPFSGGQLLHGTLTTTLTAGTSTVFTESQIGTATGLSLGSSGQRAYLFLTCNFLYAHAQTLFINPGGIVTFAPGYVIPPNRSLGTGPEQLLQ